MPHAYPSLSSAAAQDISGLFQATSARSEALVSALSESDAMLQSMEDASPAKWHLAHTTWFWETFLLRDHLDGYQLYNEDWPYLYNSYYETEGARMARAARGMLSRPKLVELLSWRAQVDLAMEKLLLREECAGLIRLGIAHEEQHQELMLTDIKHAFYQNPLGPAMFDIDGKKGTPTLHLAAQKPGWMAHPGGVCRIGHDGCGRDAGQFAFDNEGPCHQVLLEPFALATRLVTNSAWQEFIDDGGYRNARLWLSDGWAWVQRENISGPLYWRDSHAGAEQFSHYGWIAREPEFPVTHISYFEADAFASWAGARLPSECEWEALARGCNDGTVPASDRLAGNQLDDRQNGDPPYVAGALVPRGGAEMFGDCWTFTRSAYASFPRYSPALGAVGEYNGKFMSGQMVLKGASCATVRGHSRASYRNFFYPHQRWQFTGLRLAKDL